MMDTCNDRLGLGSQSIWNSVDFTEPENNIKIDCLLNTVVIYAYSDVLYETGMVAVYRLLYS